MKWMRMPMNRPDEPNNTLHFSCLIDAPRHRP
jgi:hypothetical protein